MRALLSWIDGHTNLMRVLFVFWAMFWTLNGADKFFNGKSQANLKATKSVLVDNAGEQQYTLHNMEPMGFFGVTRDNKMKGYFARLNMPASVATASLYFFAIFEVVIGVGFLLLVIWSLLPRGIRNNEEGLWGAFADRTVHRLCFKSGILVFLAFCTGDILFGDRMELWEHGTFMLLTLVTYDLWFRTDQYVEATAGD